MLEWRWSYASENRACVVENRLSIIEVYESEAEARVGRGGATPTA